MATRSQRKKELRRKKRQQKKAEKRKQSATLRQTGGRAVGSSQALRRRLDRQTPQAWIGEPPEDVAIYDDAIREALPPELATQVSAVREALQSAIGSRPDDALQRVSSISRGSPLSEWRLFIRGLTAWMADDFENAGEAWKRLDFERRPGRIAAAMMNARRTDLDRASSDTAEVPLSEDVAWASRMDDQLWYHAKLLRRVRFDRSAIRVAEAGVRIPDESPELTLGPKKLKWVRKFADEYRATEPALVAALERVALGRAFAQCFSDLFDETVKTLTGPRHDRRNRLLTYYYYLRFANDASADERALVSLHAYLTNDLPHNEELPEPLRNAIASRLHLDEALDLIDPPRRGPFDYFFSSREDDRAIEVELQAAIDAYPAHRRAYKVYVEWLEDKLEDRQTDKRRRESLLDRMTRVMEDWATGLPDDVEPRLWLVDHLLDDDQTEAAKPHVDWLAGSRQDDPRVRAAPWKWQLLEAMRLARRKTQLSEATERLNDAESLWPSWLSRQWLPYLRAAVALRGGDTDDYERQRRQVCEQSGLARDSLADACMMLGAAQRMRVPAAALKPLRGPVDDAARNADQVPAEELLDASGFFWDLQRTELVYPAYRNHGGKFAWEALARILNELQPAQDRLGDERIQTAVLWCSAHRFFSDGYDLTLPPCYSKSAVTNHPMFAAAKANAYLKLRHHWRNDSPEYTTLVPLLKAAAQSQRDPYYRHWFESLADRLTELASRDPFNFAGDLVNRMFGFSDDDDDWD